MRKEDFTEVEWQVIREAPRWAGLAVMVSGASGILGSFQEAFAVANAAASGTQHPSELIRAIASRTEAEAVDREIRGEIAGSAGADSQAAAREWVIETAIGKLRDAGRILSSKSQESAGAYRQWVLDIANEVARAAKEGALFGFGGTRVSPAEVATIRRIEAALEGTV